MALFTSLGRQVFNVSEGAPFLGAVRLVGRPVILLVCGRLGLASAPFLIAEVLASVASNIGGTATLVGDPPDIITASRAGLTFNDFLAHLAPIAALLAVVLLAMCQVMFRKAFVYDQELAAQSWPWRSARRSAAPGGYGRA